MQSQNKNKIFSKAKNIQKIGIPILFILTILLVFFNKTDYFLVYKIKSIGVDYMTPISKVVMYPIDMTAKTFNLIIDLRLTKLENAKLKEEIIRLKKWQTLALINKRENDAYKKLLNSTTNDINIVKTASVISQSPNIYSKYITVDAGLVHQIKNNYSVINERGLVGKTIFVSKNKSKVMLINDQNSSIPVKLTNKDFFAIVNGSSNGKYLISSFVKNNKKPSVGDILVTSGNANIFPRDILVGRIVDVSDGKFIALPFVDFKNIEFVQIIKNK